MADKLWIRCSVCDGEGLTQEPIRVGDCDGFAEGVCKACEGVGYHPSPMGPNVRAMFWLAVLEGLMPKMHHEDAVREAPVLGDKLWEEWKKVHESE